MNAAFEAAMQRVEDRLAAGLGQPAGALDGVAMVYNHAESGDVVRALIGDLFEPDELEQIVESFDVACTGLLIAVARGRDPVAPLAGALAQMLATGAFYRDEQAKAARDE